MRKIARALLVVVASSSGICRARGSRVAGTGAASAARGPLGSSRDVVMAASPSTEVASLGARKGPQPSVARRRPRAASPSSNGGLGRLASRPTRRPWLDPAKEMGGQGG